MATLPMINNQHIKIIFLLFCSVVCSALSMSAQEEGRTPNDAYLQSDVEVRYFDAEAWEQAKSGIRYDEQFKERKRKRQGSGTTEIDDDSADFLNARDSGSEAAWGAFFKGLFIILLVVIVAFLAYRLIGDDLNRPRSRRFDPSSAAVLMQEVEEDIHEHDLQHYTQQAAEAGNYPLAIRLYYLAILKELSLSKRIKWKRDKTNREYLNEMRATDLYGTFREVTRIFERVWYGRGELSRADFNALEPRFEQLLGAAGRPANLSTINQELASN
ncbi:MAG: DUF4129 domain-containing protein [Bacteroidota bacterium]